MATLDALEARVRTLEEALAALARNREGSTIDYLRFRELPAAAPATPPANEAHLYGRESGGVTRLFYKDDGGTERGPL